MWTLKKKKEVEAYKTYYIVFSEKLTLITSNNILLKWY